MDLNGRFFAYTGIAVPTHYHEISDFAGSTLASFPRSFSLDGRYLVWQDSSRVRVERRLGEAGPEPVKVLEFRPAGEAQVNMPHIVVDDDAYALPDLDVAGIEALIETVESRGLPSWSDASIAAFMRVTGYGELETRLLLGGFATLPPNQAQLEWTGDPDEAEYLDYDEYVAICRLFDVSLEELLAARRRISPSTHLRLEDGATDHQGSAERDRRDRLFVDTFLTHGPALWDDQERVVRTFAEQWQKTFPP
jgi:hypothetical protein